MLRTSCGALALVLGLALLGCDEQTAANEPIPDLDAGSEQQTADPAVSEAGAPQVAQREVDSGQADSGSSGETPTNDGSAEVPGACSSEADRAVVAALGEQLSCEGAACVARNLKLALPSSIDADATAVCVRQQAPNLALLSSGCQACFVRISLCVPESCVALLGAESNACGSGGVPSTDFGRCSAAAAPSSACVDCQTRRCQAEFVACSGIEPVK